jgi:hypothetical protein
MDKSVPYYFEPAPPVQYNGISCRLLEQCTIVAGVAIVVIGKWVVQPFIIPYWQNSLVALEMLEVRQ